MNRFGLLLPLLALVQLAGAQSLLGPSALSFRIRQLPPKRTKPDLVLALQFCNTGQKPIRVLTAVGSGTASLLNVLDLYVKQKGENRIMLTTGKGTHEIDPVYTYVTLLPGRTYQKVLNLSKLLQGRSIRLKPGEYKVELYYHTQEGEHCLRGGFPSNALHVQVRSAPTH